MGLRNGLRRSQLDLTFYCTNWVRRQYLHNGFARIQVIPQWQVLFATQQALSQHERSA